MKKSTLELLKALITGNNYHRTRSMRLVAFAIFLCGMSSAAFAQVTITLTTPTTIPAASSCPSGTDVNIYAFTLTGTGATGSSDLTGVSFTQSGTAVVPGDVVRYRLWKNAGAGAGTLVATSTTTSFTGIATETFIGGTVLNYWITADIATSATAGRTIIVNTMTNANLTTTGANAGTGTVPGGTQTIIARPTVTSITAAPSPICGGSNLTLTAAGASGTGGLISYNWSGPGGYNSTSVTNSKIYTTANTGAGGVYSVTVTYPGIGCTSLPQASNAVVVNDQPSLPATSFICISGGGSPTQPKEGVFLNSGVTGGNWSSSNTNVATVEPTTGKIWPLGFAAGGTTTITQIAPGGCSASTVATRATRPGHIVGPGGVLGTQRVCTQLSITLSSATPGGVWSAAFTNIATVTNGVPANVTSVTGANIAPSSGTTKVFYTDPATGCDTAEDVNVNARPFDIIGPSTHPHEVCVGSTIALSDFTAAGTWSSSVPAFAPVTPGPGISGGKVTGVNQGLTTITYTSATNACFKTYSVTVNPLPAPITGYNIVCTGSTTTLSDISPGGTWSISNSPTVATISMVPTPITVYGGTNGGNMAVMYTFTATACSVSIPLTVNLEPAQIVGPNKVCSGSTITLSDGVGGTWSSSQPAIATIDSTSGVLYGQYSSSAPQVATIHYDLTACPTKTFTVTVNPAPGPITGVPNVCIGFHTTLSDTTAGGVWSSSGPSSVATLSGNLVYGVGTGFIVDTYKLVSTGCFDTMVILVNDNPGSIMGPDSVCQGAMVTLSDATPGGTWSSDTLSIAQVIDSSGVVTGISAGNVTLSYTLATGCFDTLAFRVKPSVVASVSLSRSPGGITCAGSVDTFVATQVNGGIPLYQWYKFVTPVGFGADKYWYIPTNGDLIVVRMVTQFTCAVQDTVYDSLVAVVYPIAGANVSIECSPLDTTASYLGQVYTFFSTVTFGGGTNAYQWFKNRTLIPGATMSTYSTPVYQNDTFVCRVIGIAPCSGMPDTAYSNVIRIYASYLGVAPAVAKSDLVLFPNPTNGNITLSGMINTSDDKELSIEISDLLGHIVYRGKTMPQSGYVKEQMSLGNDMPAGAYLLRVNSESLSQVFRFIISK